MSSDHPATSSDSDGNIDVDLADLEKRIEDLEVEVYGYDYSDDLSAGEEIVITLKQIIVFLEGQHRQRTSENARDAGAPLKLVYEIAAVLGIECHLAEQAYEKLRRRGEVYESSSETVKAT